MAAKDAKLTAGVLQEMLQDRYSKNEKLFATFYDEGQYKADSPSDASYKKHMALFDKLSGPLKQMQVEYLEKVSSTCYKEKHMADDVPNSEQVSLCHNRVHERIFGKFLQRVGNVRDSNRFKYTDCLIDANNDIKKAQACITNYIKTMDKDNEDLVTFFQSQPELSKYL